MIEITERKGVEEQVHFESREGISLYGLLYHARNEMKGAIAVCAPDGEERIWSQRVLVNVARFLAAHGYTVLRFDYTGQGESEGEYEQSTLSTRLNDIESAIEFLLGRTGGTQIGLLGVRLGGSLASLIAAKSSSVQYLVLWEPVIDIPAYLFNLLRVNISYQMVMHKAVVKNREKLIEEIMAGGKVSVNGYYLTKDFFEEARATTLDGAFNAFSGKRLIVLLPGSRFPLEGVGDVRRLEFPAMWKELKIYHPRPRLLMDETLTWMKQNDL